MSDADAEAMRLMMKVVEHVEVAKSFAKIAASLLTVGALRASERLRVVADNTISNVIAGGGASERRGHARFRKVAEAAAAAAVHVAAIHREERAGGDALADGEPAPVSGVSRKGRPTPRADSRSENGALGERAGES